ncbi:MAG: succinate dehydrogenase cytochrome b subunit [Bacteroidota bacterium]
MGKASFLDSSIGRKFAMALSAFFLLFFLLQHLTINMMSVIHPETFNDVSHFMGNNFVVQAILQPILLAGVLFHFILGFILEIKNRGSRDSKYAAYKGSANASWMSRNMIISGIVILLFLLLHLYDFWLHEILVKYFSENGAENIQYVNRDPSLGMRYYPELREKFDGDIIRMILYVLSFLFLGLHLNHGFQSAFQSVGARNPKYLGLIKSLGKVYSIAVPLLFTYIAIHHYLGLTWH